MRVPNFHTLSKIDQEKSSQWYRDLRLALLSTHGYKASCLLIICSYSIGLGILIIQLFNQPNVSL